MRSWTWVARIPAGASLAIAMGATGACSGAPVRQALADQSATTLASCADRDRAHGLCVAAVASQCAAGRAECESRCEASADARLGPGSSEKEPALRGDIRGARCRQECDFAVHECERPLLAQCPSPCVGPPGAAFSPGDGGPLQPDEPADADF
jgi:hypothetical protein